MSDTPETSEAWDAVSRTPDGMYSTTTTVQDRAHTMLEMCKKLERQRNELAAKFTRLDKPRHSGDPMLDAVLATDNPAFNAWVASLPTTYWARYDLSAIRIGWEAAKSEGRDV